MAVIETEYNELCSLIGEKIGKEKLLDRIFMLGTPVDAVDGDRIFVEIFPNRPDCLSVEGLARALSTFVGAKKGLGEYSASKPKIALKAGEVKARPFIAAAVARNVKITDAMIRSLMQVQEKLHETLGRKRKKVAIGLHDLDRVKPPFAYKAVKPESVSFVPLDIKEKLNLRQILERHPKGKQYASVLENASLYPVITDSEGDVLSFPPIINGELTRVTEKTRNVLIEVTGTSKAAVNDALNIIACIFADRGASLEKVRIGKEETPDLSPKRARLNAKGVEKLLGIKVDAKEAAALLEKMGHNATAKGNSIDVLIPCYRNDIMDESDLIEDIGIAYGFERLAPRKPAFPTTGGKSPGEEFLGKVREALAGFGFQEVMTFMLTSEDRHYKLLGEAPGERIRISNPLTRETTMVRTSLLPSVLETLANNRHHKYPQMLFEAGEAVEKDGNAETGGRTVRRLCAVIADASATFTSMQSILEGIARELGMAIRIKEKDFPFMIPGRSALIPEANGFVGEVHPAVLNRLGIEVPVSCFEIEIRGESE